MTPEQILADLVREASKDGNYCRTADQQRREVQAAVWAADRIESLTAQLAAAGEQLRQMREALTAIDAQIQMTQPDMGGNHFYCLRKARIASVVMKVRAAAQLEPTAAEATARKNAQNAAKWGELCDWFRERYNMEADSFWLVLGVLVGEQENRAAKEAADA